MEQLLQAHQSTSFVRKDKRGHQVTRFWSRVTDSGFSQSAHQTLHGVAERRPLGADGFCKGRQTLGQRTIHIAAFLKQVIEW
jgi:hypothetical protein